MLRVFAADVTLCARCGHRLIVLAAITHPPTATAIIDAIRRNHRALARPPPPTLVSAPSP